jgi:hypothetical protein
MVSSSMQPAAIKSPAMVRGWIFALLVLAVTAAAVAHHSIAGVYDNRQSVTIEALKA